MFLIFDTETTGLPKDFNAPVTDSDNWPRCVQLAWQLHDAEGKLIEDKEFVITPDGYDIPFNAAKVHGITTEIAQQHGHDLKFVLEEFEKAVQRAEYCVGHNIEFDLNIVGAEHHRVGMESRMMDHKVVDSKTDAVANYTQIPGGRGGKFKWPTLTELHEKLFGEAFAEAHNAAADVEATARCFLELVRLGVITKEVLEVEEEFFKRFRAANPNPIEAVGINLRVYQDATASEEITEGGGKVSEDLAQTSFSHLHVHTQFSVLQATCKLDALVDKAHKEGMPAVAMTDHSNLMGAYQFLDIAAKRNKGAEKPVKPIVGCEYFVCKDHKDKSKKDDGFQTVLIAKNKRGFLNLAKLSSTSYVDGFYYVPRIDRELVTQYKENVMATTGGLYGEVPSLILNVGLEAAEEAFCWWHEQFGEDFYIELLRHDLEEERQVNKVLLEFAKKYDVKYFASNNCYYLDAEDANAHDILLCIKDGEKQSTPIGRGRGFRYGFPNQEFYFKSQEQMRKLFSDLPEAVATTNEIVEKCEPYVLSRDVLLPKFDIPQEFVHAEDEQDGGKRGENAYLRHLTYEGAKERYGEITDEIRERLDFELETIERTGYPGYFLIVQDFTTAAREMGCWVGPGRGSAAGSAVAYCIGITNCDPIKYDLLFERFLNPDRVSLPDIDIDFDDEKRGDVIDWVVEKYGASQVAQIITYGTMAAKSSIRDTARALDLPLFESDRLAKLVPDIKLNKLFNFSDDELKAKLNAEQVGMANELRKIIGQDGTPEGETLKQAKILEGSLRNTGIHACGVIITPEDITGLIPVTTAKDSDLYVTQFDNSVVEDAGLLKMDFLGLKTLTLIKDAVRNVKKRHGVEVDPDEIPLDDEKTYELFQRGETVGIFQFESPGMQKHLKSLKPDQFGDLIAMNALYRPGPLEYIPNFIARKHGWEEITYDLPEMKEYLEETYGITVYQEQVMLLSQKLANFTKGEADALRKAMGKKKKDILDKMFPKFLEGGEKNGHPKKVLEKVWKDWEAFAAYAFNKSHSTCYSMVAFHTAYFKANYPAEYMASVLSNNMNDIKSVSFFMEECKRMGIPVLGPDVNESEFKFTVNDEGAIRFGLGAVKGVGSGPVNAIIAGREEGPYKDVFDMLARVDLKNVNKRVMESLALSGALDNLSDLDRSQYFGEDAQGRTYIESLVKFAIALQAANNNSTANLFGDSMAIEVAQPTPPPKQEWPTLVKLQREREVVGIFISGHPLDDFKLDIDAFCTGGISALNDLEPNEGRELVIAGIVTSFESRISRKGTEFGTFDIEDYTDQTRLFLFGEKYMKYRHFISPDTFLMLKGKVQKRKWGDELEFDITDISLLGEARDNFASELRLTFNYRHLNEGMIGEINRLVNEYPGSTKVKFIARDEENNLEIKLPSTKAKVNLDNRLLKELDGMTELGYKIG